VHSTFIASLQAELRITLATTLAPYLNAGYVRTLEWAESDYHGCSWSGGRAEGLDWRSLYIAVGFAEVTGDV